MGWLEQIPSHWETPRLGFLIGLNPSKGEVRSEPEDLPVSFVRMENIGESGGLELNSVKKLSEVIDGYTYFADDDVLVGKITPCFENGKGALAEALESGIGFGTTELHVLRPTERIIPKFLFYLSISHHFRSMGEASMYGAAGQKRVPEEYIFGFRHPVPPVSEQHQIVHFLDHQTENIDDLIAKKQRLIELLEEKRTALITHAVTEGLNPDVRMKVSGVEWLGEIPEHWDATAIRWVAQTESGHTPTRGNEAYWGDEGFPWISLGDSQRLREVDYIADTKYRITKDGIANSSARVLPSGSVVFSRDATVGLCAITTEPSAVSQHFVAWICGERILPEYLLQVIKAMRPELQRLTAGATISTIGMPEIAGLSTPVPPLSEQRAIVDRLRDQTGKLQRIIQSIGEALELLAEYRSALITAAVTGQIDVRGRAALK